VLWGMLFLESLQSEAKLSTSPHTHASSPLDGTSENTPSTSFGE
jgi:hypothetical protein